jgi:hypothetical protein
MRRALLLVVVSLLAGGCTRLQDRQTTPDDRATMPKDRETIRSFIAEVQPWLDAQRSVLGPVENHGDEIDLLGGRLKLVVRVLHDGEAGDTAPVHVHVLATPKDRKAGRLDLCIVGTHLADAARALTENALPPLVSAVRELPVLDASHAWSDTLHGIPGHTAYLGGYYVRRDADSPAVSSALYAGILANLPELPRDGRMHLLKLVVVAQDGDWIRNLELDGDIKLETARPLNIPSRAAAMVVSFVVLDAEADPRDDPGAREEAHRRLAAHPTWLPDPTECPAKILPARFATHDTWDDTAARGGRLLYAVRACESGDRDHCYAAAQELLAEDQASAAAQSLFLAACHLGIASGCTNAAASRPLDDCSLATYEASCDPGDDPWGCAMLGHSLVRGDPRHRDLQRARTVLPKACRISEDDPACQAASQILESLDNMPSAGPGAPRTGW